MNSLTTDCCGEKTCWTMPPEFVRVRYFYGQRLGVMELADEASYHAGKQAFHNARAHGAGVLCGLAVDRFVFTPGSKTTVLRVHKGAALDPCGREVIVGGDQCIDVAAWYAKNKARPELAGWTTANPPTLYVAVRYHECPSDPCTAPRDPCGCDNGGCEFGRVREGFELALLTDKEKDKLKIVQFPDPAAFTSLLSPPPQTGGDTAAVLNAALDTLVANACPAPDDSPWLALAAVTVLVDGTGNPTDLGSPNIQLAERLSLLPTNALQALVLRLTASSIASGALAVGPSFGALTFNNQTGPLGLALVPAVGSQQPAVSSATFAASMVTLQLLGATGWTSILLGGSTPSCDGTQITATIDLPSLSAALSAPQQTAICRLTIAAPVTAPIADAQGRPLTPLSYSRTLRFVRDASNSIVLDPAF